MLSQPGPFAPSSPPWALAMRSIEILVHLLHLLGPESKSGYDWAWAVTSHSFLTLGTIQTRNKQNNGQSVKSIDRPRGLLLRCLLLSSFVDFVDIPSWC